MADVNNITVTSDEKIIFEALETLRMKRKGQYSANILDITRLKYGWSLETVNSVLKMMIRKNLLYEVQKGTVISYRITKLTEKALTTNTTPDNSYKDLYENLSKDFDDFKRYVFHELALLRDHKASLSHNEPIQNNVIDLKERIASLEKQLKGKDVLIENLLRNKTPNNQDAHKKNDFVPVTSNEKRIVINSTPQRKAKIQKITSKNAVIVGDSMLKGLNPKGFKNHKISVKVHPGSTSDDLLHYVNQLLIKSQKLLFYIAVQMIFNMRSTQLII